MKLKKRVYIFAILLGLVTVVAVYYYMQGIKAPAIVVEDMTTVVVANNTIPAHERVKAEMVSLKSLPTVSVHPDAAKTIEEVLGFTTKVEIINGEQILKSRVATEVNEASLSYRIPENMRAIAIPMTEISGVAGYVDKGDKVDIIVTYNDVAISPGQLTVTQFQNIEILEKGPLAPVEGNTETSGVTSSLVLLVDPSQAEVLAYSIVSGSIQMTLRNPIDNTIKESQGVEAVNFATWRAR